MKRYSKFVIIAASNLDNRIINLFGLEYLLSQAVVVEFWDVSKITYNYPTVHGEVNSIPSFYFSNKNVFKEMVRSRLPGSLCLVYMNYAPQTAFVYRCLSKNNIDIMYCVNGVLPGYSSSSVGEKLRSISLHKIKSVLLAKLFDWIKPLPLYTPARYQLNTCSKATTGYKVDKGTLMIPFNSTDYVLSAKEDKRLVMGEYVVFIDINLPFHPDNTIAGWNVISSSDYYPFLNSFFDKIEKENKCEVVIAAHPTSTIYKGSVFFHGRKVFWGQTCNLIKYSCGVIDHCSTAISFAVLFQKPVITIVSKRIQEHIPQLYNSSVCFSKEINSKMVYIDDQQADSSFKIVDKSVYNKYKYNYITNPESENKSNGEILLSLLSKE